MPLVRVVQRRISVAQPDRRGPTPFFRGQTVMLSDHDYRRLGAAVELVELPEAKVVPVHALPELWFVTPAWQRTELTEVCLAERAWLAERLADRVVARTVVIADDANVETAERLGMATVRLNNRSLGAKFNAGFRFAADQGADFFCPVGSDTWLRPELFRRLPGDGELLCNRDYAVVTEDGTQLVHMRLDYEAGIGSRVMPRALLAPFEFAPAREDIKRGVDSSILSALKMNGEVKTTYQRHFKLSAVGFQSRVQLNPVRFASRYETKREPDPFERLAEVYPAGLVAQVREVYA